MEAPPLLDFTVKAASLTAGQPIMFDAVSDGLTPTTLSWDFGDGTTGQGASLTHTYATSGTYMVYLTGTYSTFPPTSALHFVTVT
jgi:PKD repeat protein